MIRIPLTVHYADGRQQTVTGTQYGMAAYAQHAARTGLPMPKPGDTTDMGALVQLRFMAYAELARNANGKHPAWPAWDQSVDEVTAEDAAPVDPTRPATSAG